MRRRALITGLAVSIIMTLGGSGCAERRATVAKAFPLGTVAAPWRLDGEVWDGDFTAAATALGDDANSWQKYQPSRVWLAAYTHDTHPSRRLVARAFGFENETAAVAAYDVHAPPMAQAIKAGDAACWLEDGVLVRWGRLVFEVIGDAKSPAAAEQALYLYALIEKHITADLAKAPQ